MITSCSSAAKTVAVAQRPQMQMQIPIAAKPVYKPELEQDLARCLLESHCRIVELAIEQYRSSIQNQTRIIVRLLERERHNDDDNNEQQHRRQQQQENNICNNNSGGNHPRYVAKSLAEGIQRTLACHRREVVEEQYIAMASIMVAVRETKLTENFARKIRNGVDTILNALQRSADRIEIYRVASNSSYYSATEMLISNVQRPFQYRESNHYYNNSDNAAPAAHNDDDRNRQGAPIVGDVDVEEESSSSSSSNEIWDRTIVEALKVDGYYRWFHANNGVLLIGGGGAIVGTTTKA